MENNSELIIYTTEDNELKKENTMRKFGKTEFSTKPTELEITPFSTNNCSLMILK